MKEVFDSYLTIFMHPFRSYDFFYNGIPLPGRELSPFKKLTLTEAISVSWLISILRAFMDLMLLNLALHAVMGYFSDNESFFTLMGKASSFSGYYFFLLKLIIETLLFPILAYAWAMFWQFFLKLLGDYLEVEEAEEKAHLIVSNSLTANFIRIIPVFGDIGQGIVSVIHIFAGIKKSFELDTRAALLAISLPFMLFCLFFAFILVCFSLLLL